MGVCPQCGTESAEGDRFCRGCGSGFETEQLTSVVQTNSAALVKGRQLEQAVSRVFQADGYVTQCNLCGGSGSLGHEFV
jgi:uncharacterized membrane protein YvbJ